MTRLIKEKDIAGFTSKEIFHFLTSRMRFRGDFDALEQRLLEQGVELSENGKPVFYVVDKNKYSERDKVSQLYYDFHYRVNLVADDEKQLAILSLSYIRGDERQW